MSHDTEPASVDNILSDADIDATYLRGGPTHAELLRDRRGRQLLLDEAIDALEDALSAFSGHAGKVSGKRIDRWRGILERLRDPRRAQATPEDERGDR